MDCGAVHGGDVCGRRLRFPGFPAPCHRGLTLARELPPLGLMPVKSIRGTIRGHYLA